MNDCRAIDRRDFLKFTGLSSAGLIFGMRLGAQEESADRLAPDLFVSLEPDGAIHIVAHRSEMGTGIRSVLPMVVATSWARGGKMCASYRQRVMPNMVLRIRMVPAVSGGFTIACFWRVRRLDRCSPRRQRLAGESGLRPASVGTVR